VPQASPFFRQALIFAVLLVAVGIALRGIPSAAESARLIPPPVLDETANPQATSEVAILAGGCFWVFRACSCPGAAEGWHEGLSRVHHRAVHRRCRPDDRHRRNHARRHRPV
jgi:hypothetical protein